MYYDILINKNNKIDKNYYNNVILNLIEIDYSRPNDSYYLTENLNTNKIYLEKKTAEMWYLLKEKINSLGIKFDICSGFRSFYSQQIAYNNFLEKHGKEMTEKRFTLPGYSEHHSGLAIDCDYFINGDWAGIVLDDDGLENAENQIIHNELHKYGFILRYPKNKTSITNMQYEPWHIRYVGIELATEIFNNNITLEEYHENKLTLKI